MFREEDEQKPVDEVERICIVRFVFHKFRFIFQVEELTPEEENIKGYLQDGEPLAPEILDKIVKPWWTEEPYRSRGIVLEGFPSAEDEVYYMIENQLMPDVIIELDVESKDVVKRILPKRVEQWTKRMQLKKDKRDNKKGKKDRDMVRKMVLFLNVKSFFSLFYRKKQWRNDERN